MKKMTRTLLTTTLAFTFYCCFALSADCSTPTVDSELAAEGIDAAAEKSDAPSDPDFDSEKIEAAAEKIEATAEKIEATAEKIEATAEKIEVKPGPEDMVIDTLQGYPRLLISCSARREEQKPYGEIISYGLHSGDQVEMIRYNEPGDILFKPHGIYLDGDLLYVISHETEPDHHPILIYRVHGDSLEFVDSVNSPDQHSPNALVTGPDGEIYFVNDSGKRGSMAEKIFKLKRASVVRLSKNADGVWESDIVAEKLSYPAGINRIGNRLYAGDAIQNQIHVYEIDGDKLEPVGKIENLKGNDNIRIYKGQLLTACHVKPFKFIKHAKKSDKLSPVEVYQVDPETGGHASLYYTDGSQISAGSTAVTFENHLYICQVFDPFILKVALKN